MSKSNDSFANTLKVVVALSLVCSIVVSVAAVGLKPKQQVNKLLDKQRNILEAAGLLEQGADINATFEQFIDSRVIALDSGQFVTAEQLGQPLADFDQRAAAKDPAMNLELSADEDAASIKRRANFASVYLAKDSNGTVSNIILPVHGYGLWSTMYAFVAITPDGTTVDKLVYYDHGETPGLGGEIANPDWEALWSGKQLYSPQGEPLKVTKAGQADPNSLYEVDGLSGATLTANGVSNTFTFWLGDRGFGPFLAKVRDGGLNNG